MLAEIKEIIKMILKEWSFYFFIIFTIINFIPFYSFGVSTFSNISDLGISLAILPIITFSTFLIYLLLLLRLRNKAVSNRNLYFTDLIFSIIKHGMKLFFTMVLLFSILILINKLLFPESSYLQTFTKFSKYLHIIIIPSSILVNGFLISNLAFFLYTGRTQYSMRGAFSLLKLSFKPITILSTIQVSIPFLITPIIIYFNDSYTINLTIGFIFSIFNNFIYTISIVYIIKMVDDINEGVLLDYKREIEPDFT